MALPEGWPLEISVVPPKARRMKLPYRYEMVAEKDRYTVANELCDQDEPHVTHTRWVLAFTYPGGWEDLQEYLVGILERERWLVNEKIEYDPGGSEQQLVEGIRYLSPEGYLELVVLHYQSRKDKWGRRKYDSYVYELKQFNRAQADTLDSKPLDHVQPTHSPVTFQADFVCNVMDKRN